jgi:alcohol dehydrogenase
MGVHHGLAQLVGGRTGIPHGLANAILLTHALRFNAGDPALYEPLARIGAAMGDEDDPAGAADRLRERLGLPGRLSEAGVTEDDLDAVTRMVQTSVSIRHNPRSVSEEDARGILDAAF